MAEIEHFLSLDWRFRGFAEGFKAVALSPERDKWRNDFFKGIWRLGYYKGDEVMIRSRAYQACVYVSLYDEECADSEGLEQAHEDLGREWSSTFFDPARGKWVSRSIVPYDLNQCERTYGPSHVDDGGGDALDSTLRGERTYGPSHVDDGGGDASQSNSMLKFEGRAGGQDSNDGSSQGIVMCTELTSTLGQTGTCDASGIPLNT
jgi:hypothetical protein